MKRVQDKRVWIGAGVAAAVLIVAVGWFMFIGPELSSTRDLHSQATTTQQQNALLQQKVHSLQVKSTKLNRYKSSLNAALLALPADSGLPAFTRQINAQAGRNQVVVSSVVVGGISAIVSTVAPAATPAGSAPTAGAVATPAATPAAGAPATAGSVFSVQVTVQSSGTLAHQLDFLSAVRTAGPRRALVTGSQVTPGTGANATSIDGAASFMTQLTIFSAPQTPEQIVQLKKLLNGNVGN